MIFITILSLENRSPFCKFLDGCYCIAESCYFGAALWSKIEKSTGVSTGLFNRPFAHSLAPLTCSLAPDCSLRSRPPLCSLLCSLAHFAYSLTHGKVID